MGRSLIMVMSGVQIYIPEKLLGKMSRENVFEFFGMLGLTGWFYKWDFWNPGDFLD